VEVDGRPAGDAPLVGPLLVGPGHHALKASREGADPDTRELDAVSGQKLAITLAPRARVTTATLRVATKPPGSNLTVDGKFAGVAPWQGTLEPGGHEVRAERKGYEKARLELVLTAGQEREVTLELAPTPKGLPVYRRWTTWTPVALVLAVGVVGAGVGGWYATHPSPDDHLDFRAH
jgi:hypothetical protein